MDCSEAVEISAKSGLNVDKVLEEIVHKLPSPKGDKEAPTQALVFDSFYDSYRGIIAFVSVKNGTIKPKDKIRFMATALNMKSQKWVFVHQKKLWKTN